MQEAIDMEEVQDKLLREKEALVCSECNGIMRYKSLGHFVCEDCGNEYLDDYGRVRDFLDRRGPSSAIEISTATGVSRKRVTDLINSGRIMVTADSGVSIFCEVCGQKIRYGVRCDRCSHLPEDLSMMDRKARATEVYRKVSRAQNMRAYDDHKGGMRFIGREGA